MRSTEYERIKDYTYFQYCDYLRNKYKNNSKRGLFKHHFYEIYKAGLSNLSKQDYLTDREKYTIIYCDFLEHLLLHIIIAEFNKDCPQLQLGINGAIKIYGCIYNYQTYKQMDYKEFYYNGLDPIVTQKLLKRLKEVNRYYGKDIYIDCYIPPIAYRRQLTEPYYEEDNAEENKYLKERFKEFIQTIAVPVLKYSLLVGMLICLFILLFSV